MVKDVERLVREIVDAKLRVRANCAARTTVADITPIVEISQRTGLSVGNVGYKLHHLLKSLGESLRRMGIESAEG